MKWKMNWHFTKWNGLCIVLVRFNNLCIFSWCFKSFFGLANILLQISLKTGGKSEECFEIVVKTLSLAYSILNNFHLKLKNVISLLCRGLKFNFFAYGYIHNVVSTLPNVVKLDVENNNVLFVLYNVVHINF